MIKSIIVAIFAASLISLSNCISFELDQDDLQTNSVGNNDEFVPQYFKYGEEMEAKKKRPEFMGNAVSIPQYMRLVNLQNATIEMDKYMKSLAKKFSPKILMSDPSWRELVLIYRSLEKLLPDDVKAVDKAVVWWN